jgi:hypothetical protein
MLAPMEAVITKMEATTANLAAVVAAPEAVVASREAMTKNVQDVKKRRFSLIIQITAIFRASFEGILRKSIQIKL